MNYANSESGAVTVDWVVLTAGLVGLGVATMAVVSAGVQDASEDVRAELSTGIPSHNFVFPGGLDINGDTIVGLGLYGSTASIAANDTLGSVTGATSIYVAASDPTGNAGFLNFSVATEEMQAGKTYRMSFWARGDGTSGQLQYNFQTGSGDVNALSQSGVNIGEDWTYVEQVVTLDEAKPNFYVLSQTAGMSFAIDDMKVERLQ